MRLLLTLVIAVLAVPDRPDPTPKEKAKPLHEQILGEWQTVSVISRGQPEQGKKVDDTIFVFTKDNIAIREGNRDRSEDAAYTLDASKNPAAIDITPKQGGGMRIEGILKLEGDTLTLCFHQGDGSVRPAAFASTAENRLTLVHFKRVKK